MIGRFRNQINSIRIAECVIIFIFHMDVIIYSCPNPDAGLANLNIRTMPI